MLSPDKSDCESPDEWVADHGGRNCRNRQDFQPQNPAASCHNPKFETIRTSDATLTGSLPKTLRKESWHEPKKKVRKVACPLCLRIRIHFVRMTTMKRNIPVPVFVLALLIGQLSCNAEPPVPQSDGGRVAPAPGSNLSLVPSKYSLRKFAPIRTGDAVMPEDSFNGYAQIRSNPDLGAPGSAGNGFHHFSMPFDRYTSWYRPRAATLTKYQRCAPGPFRPRGFGNLFARPCDGYRMEFEPYTLADSPSKYGPSYFARLPDPRCNNCCHGQDECECE